MPRYLCVVCKSPAVVHRRRLADRTLAVCGDHLEMDGDELLKVAAPLVKGSREMFRIRAQLAARTRANPDGDYSELKRDLAFATICGKIEAMMAAGPELTEAQRERLVSLLG